MVQDRHAQRRRRSRFGSAALLRDCGTAKA